MGWNSLHVVPDIMAQISLPMEPEHLQAFPTLPLKVENAVRQERVSCSWRESIMASPSVWGIEIAGLGSV